MVKRHNETPAPRAAWQTTPDENVIWRSASRQRWSDRLSVSHMAAVTPSPPPSASASSAGKRPLTFRQLHRWVGAGVAVFLILVSATGVILEWQQFFGEDEAERERIAEMTSAVSLDSPLEKISAQFAAARATVRAEAGAASIDRVVWQLKGDKPVFEFFTGGAQPQRYIVDAHSAAIVRRASAETESLLLRLHTGEAFGDGGKVLGMLWGVATLVITVTGLVIYWRMRRPGAGRPWLGRVFW